MMVLMTIVACVGLVSIFSIEYFGSRNDALARLTERIVLNILSDRNATEEQRRFAIKEQTELLLYLVEIHPALKKTIKRSLNKLPKRRQIEFVIHLSQYDHLPQSQEVIKALGKTVAAGLLED